MVIDAWSRYFVESSCLPTHNIVPHISWHDLPYRGTTKKYEDSRIMDFFSSLRGNSQTWLCNCPQYLSAAQVYMINERCWFSKKLLYLVLSTSDQCFVFPANLTSSTYRDKNNPFSRCTNKHSREKPSPNRISIGFSQIAFSITVLPKDDDRDFAQKERLGLPYWTMISAICVVVDESQCLDIPIWEFSVILERLSFLPGCKQILRQLLVPRNLAVWK